MSKYSIGVDFGTLSGRSLLVDIETGEELATASLNYNHGVIDNHMPSGKKLLSNWALQHPQDYLDVLSTTIPKVIQKSGVSAHDIVGLGIDFTVCTILPVKKDGTPLCFIDKFKDDPHAYVKLWKHHAAQSKADQLNEIAKDMGQKWLSRYGGTISSEWFFPKVWQLLDEAPEIYEEADHFIEAGDWIVWQLTGNHTRNACAAGYKAMWHKEDGYPDTGFFKSLDPRLENIVEEKLNIPILSIGEKAGEITIKASKMTGLNLGTAVAVGHGDAHVALPALKIDGPGKMLNIIGTSSCHIILSEQECFVPGICGVVEDGVYPGYFGYEAGQNSVGDMFSWFIENNVGSKYFKKAKSNNMTIHDYLTMKAKEMHVGENALIALDWWNGNRTTLVNLDLTGMIVGYTLNTKPEEIYRALIESAAYGTRKIIENFREHGVTVDEFYATGGIAEKNTLLLQIYADVLNMPINVGKTSQGSALGSAIFGAVAAGHVNGGYDDLPEASKYMGKLDEKKYYPNAENVKTYDLLYSEYSLLYDYFGRGSNDVMKRLQANTFGSNDG